LSEGFNVFILQAMCRGLPVVASAAGGVFSLITDGETGLIVPKRDVSLFADKIQAYLDDKEYADRIGRNGFNFVQKNYPLLRMLDSTLEVYNSVEAGTKGENAL
jgi:glycosyltransferase involved in cell wall biosynthesis